MPSLKKVATIFFIFLCAVAFPQKIIKTEGTGSTAELARSSALSAMSQTFRTSVQSFTDAEQSITQTAGKSTKTKSISTIEKKILVTSEMPLYGVKFKTSDNGRKGKELEYTVIATMDSKDALPSYREEIYKIVEKINSRSSQIGKISPSNEDTEWQLLAADYASFDKLEMALTVLGARNDIQPDLSPAEFRIKYERRAKEITSIEKAGEAVAESIKKQAPAEKIYVYPPVFESDNASTEFSVALANSVKSNLGKKLAIAKLAASSELRGSYYFAPGSADGEDIIANFYLCDKNGDVLASSGMVKIPYRVYSAYKYVPRSYNLQNEIESGRVADTDFDISIRINGDRNALDFKTGDALMIDVRASASCYIYVLGYVYNDSEDPYTYLYPFDVTQDGKEMFVKKIPAKDVNKWVNINPVMGDEVLSIEIEPPYGEEMLYVFASTTDDFDGFVSKIPSYIETDSAYIVSGSPEQNLSKTRALNIKKAAKKAAKVEKTAESAVSFFSHK